MQRLPYVTVLLVKRGSFAFANRQLCGFFKIIFNIKSQIEEISIFVSSNYLE